MPFRSQPSAHEAPEASEVVRDAVSQMVRQFADPYAFYRELVQNSLDAGATEIVVRIVYERSPGNEEPAVARVSVSDDGCGMDLETLERCLLVLFRSSKDNDASKIGKFGVGFFSVFAIVPSHVVVNTRARDACHKLTLFTDHTYEVEESSGPQGTTVTLHIPMPDAHFAPFARRSVEALAHWCPHIAIPLRVVVLGADNAHAESRIDAPLSLDLPGVLEHTDPDGTRFAIALDEAETARFYNRGLLLAARPSGLSGVSFKLDCPTLSHTLSRDDVRHDAHLARVLKRVEQLAGRPLRTAALRAFHHAVDTYARAADAFEPFAYALDSPARRAAFEAFTNARVALSTLAPRMRFARVMAEAHELIWPRMHPENGLYTVAFDAPLLLREPRVGSMQRGLLTRILTARGHTVVDLRLSPEMHALFHAVYPKDAVDADTWCGVHALSPDALSPDERAVLAVLTRCLVGVGLQRVCLAEFVGAFEDRLAIALPEQDSGPYHLVEPARLGDDPLSWRGSGAVAVARNHKHTQACVAAAQHDPLSAGVALARWVLLEYDRLHDADDAALVERALFAQEGA